MAEPERTFNRFSGTEGDETVLGDFGTVLNEHSEHIEKIEAALEGAQLALLRITNILEKLSAWQWDVAGELANSLGLDLRPSPEDR